MILPWLRGFLDWKQVPLTWTLVAINLLFYVLTAGSEFEIPNLTKREMQWAGRYYAQMKQEPVPVSPVKLLLKGSQAVRDPAFFEALPTFHPANDAVGFELWRAHMTDFQNDLAKRPAELFGLQGGHRRPLTWVTYQFMHSGWMHVAGNMLMLFIFGAALEHLTGSFLIVFVYLFGGIVGAWGFLWLSPSTTAPMVGASASLSAIMAFYALMERRKRVRFFYFLSPSPGYWGDIYLPTLIILPLYFVEDLASYLSTSTEIGAGIAYAAHLGGAFFGITLAITFRWALRHFPQWERILYASYSRSRTEAP